MHQVDGMRVASPKPKISSVGNKERERKRKEGKKGKKKRKKKERKIQCLASLRCSKGESSANQEVSSFTHQEVGISPILVPFYLRAINGHIVQSQPWG